LFFLQVVHWVSMDTAASVIRDFALRFVPVTEAPADHQEKQLSPLSANIVHPKPVPWTDVMENIRQALVSAGKPELKLVSWSKWIEALESQAKASQSAAEDLVSSCHIFWASASRMCSFNELMFFVSTACEQTYGVVPGRRR
jgi:hypothetical protein